MWISSLFSLFFSIFPLTFAVYFIDPKNTGISDGSTSYPFRTISQALDVVGTVDGLEFQLEPKEMHVIAFNIIISHNMTISSMDNTKLAPILFEDQAQITVHAAKGLQMFNISIQRVNHNKDVLILLEENSLCFIEGSAIENLHDEKSNLRGLFKGNSAFLSLKMTLMKDLSVSSGIVALTGNSFLYITDSQFKNLLIDLEGASSKNFISISGSAKIDSLVASNLTLKTKDAIFLKIDAFQLSDWLKILKSAFSDIKFDYFDEQAVVKASSLSTILINSSSFTAVYGGEIIAVSTVNQEISFLNGLFKSCIVKNGLHIKEAKKATTENSLCTHQNKDDLNKNNTDGGPCFRLLNVISTSFKGVAIEWGYAYSNTVGIKLIADSSFSEWSNSENLPEVLIVDGKFNNNYAYYTEDLETGCVIYCLSPYNIVLSGAYFERNEFEADESSLTMLGGPCLRLANLNSVLKIDKSNFIGNRGSYNSLCLELEMNEASITDSNFLSNKAIFTEETRKVIYEDPSGYINTVGFSLEPNTYGGSISVVGAYILTINNISVRDGIAYQGGAVYLSTGAAKWESKLTITNSIFEGILANGGAIMLAEDLKYSKIYLDGNKYGKNLAQMGACIASLFNSLDVEVFITNSHFYQNTADWGCALDMSHLSGIVHIENSILEYGMGNPSFYLSSGVALKITGDSDTTIVISRSNIFRHNTAIIIGRGSIIFFGGNFTDYGSEFDQNKAFDGGISYMLSAPRVKFFGSKFLNSESESSGGCLVIKERATVLMDGVTFKNCRGKNRGGAIGASENAYITLKNSVIEMNYADTGGILYVTENLFGSILFESCNFTRNTANTALIDTVYVAITITNCRFFDHIVTLFLTANSNLSFLSVKIYNSTCSATSDSSLDGCILNLNQDSVSVFYNSIIEEVVAAKGGSVVLKDSALNLSNVTFNNNFGPAYGSAITSYSSSVDIKGGNFFNYNINCIYAEESHVRINNSIFEMKNNKTVMSSSSIFGAVACINCLEILVELTNFLSNTRAQKGAALYLENSILNLNTSLCVLRRNNFIGNFAENQGGAIHALDQRINIMESLFQRNYAKYGGALYFAGDEDASSAFVSVTDSSFDTNIALKEGGAIKWIGKKISYSGNKFVSNQAFYGPNVASYPIRLICSIYTNNQISKQLERVYNSRVNNSITFDIENVVTGTSVKETLILEAIDMDDQIITTLDEIPLLVDVSEVISESGENIQNEDQKYIFYGSNSFFSKQGIFVVENLKILTSPGKILTIKLWTPSIPKVYRELIELANGISPLEKVGGQEYYFALNLSYRYCIEGEIYNQQGKICQSCPEGEYSLNRNDKACQKCPDNAQCLGGSKIKINKGYWRSYNYSKVNIFYCFAFENYCLGGFNSSCDIGYTGPLCSSCAKEGSKTYTKFGDNLCIECMNFVLNMLKILGIFLIFFLFIAVMVRAFVRDAVAVMTKAAETGCNTVEDVITVKKFFNIYLKILLNYIQMSSILNSLDLKWPIKVQNFLNVQSNVGSASQQVISFDCFVSDMNLGIEPIYLRSILSSILPWIISSIFNLYWVVRKIQKPSRNVRFAMLISIIISCQFIQPSLIKELTDNISCKNIDGVKYISKDLKVSCETSEFKAWKFIFVLPNLIFWVAVWPLYFLLYILKNRQRLNHVQVKTKVGFFYKGYKPEAYYWEFVIMYRKIIIILVWVFLDWTEYAKATLLLLLLSVAGYLQVKFKPFVSDDLNSTEAKAIFTATISLFMGLFFFSPIGDFGQMLIFVLIVFFNVTFFLHWFMFLLITLFKRSNFSFLSRISPGSVTKLQNFLIAYQITVKHFSPYNYIFNYKILMKKYHEVTAQPQLYGRDTSVATTIQAKGGHLTLSQPREIGDPSEQGQEDLANKKHFEEEKRKKKSVFAAIQVVDVSKTEIQVENFPEGSSNKEDQPTIHKYEGNSTQIVEGVNTIENKHASAQKNNETKPSHIYNIAKHKKSALLVDLDIQEKARIIESQTGWNNTPVMTSKKKHPNSAAESEGIFSYFKHNINGKESILKGFNEKFKNAFQANSFEIVQNKTQFDDKRYSHGN